MTKTLSPLATRLRETAGVWARSQYELVMLAAEFADSGEWALDGSPTAASWLADVADVEACTTREWIRIGRSLRDLHASAGSFKAGELSYSKIRTLTRVATAENDAELVDLAKSVPAADLGRAIAAWLQQSTDPDALENYPRTRRSIKWRNDPDGMVSISMRLPPLLAGVFIAILTSLVMRSKPRRQADGTWPTLAQQHADALEELLTDGAGTVNAEVVLHVRGDGTAMDDGTPVPASVIERIADVAAIRAMIHDAEGKPINISGRHRHPTTRQKRVVKERLLRSWSCVAPLAIGNANPASSPVYQIGSLHEMAQPDWERKNVTSIDGLPTSLFAD